MKTKRALSAICASVICICCSFPSVQAKVIEPEVIKTETWTTSYYIDDDVDTLYPYVQCEADIYNDGTIKLYMWNTHEWDGFVTVKHDINFYNSAPLSDSSIEALLVLSGSARDDHYEYTNNEDDATQAELRNKISYYPSTYELQNSLRIWSDLGANIGEWLYIPVNTLEYNGTTWSTSSRPFSIYFVQLSQTALPNIKVLTQRANWHWSFSPTAKTDLSSPQQFRLFGHDITITPELLAGEIIAEPELTEQEMYIKQLEAENAALKAENATLKSQISILSATKFCDVDQDGVVGVSDAQLVLEYYTAGMIGLVAEDEPIEIWYTKRNTVTE